MTDALAARPESLRSTGWAAVMFDLDGTLVDSRHLHAAAYAEAMADAGLHLEPESYHAAYGLPFEVAIEQMLAGREPGMTREELHRAKAAAFSRLVRDGGVQLLPAAGLVPILSGHVPTALVTSASAATVGVVLERLGWIAAFDVVIHGGNGLDPKPSPAPYLAAADRLGVAPKRCLVFEDSEPGVAAARSAGCSVIDVRLSPSPPAPEQP
jgi:HAD superfamily hydrolase (TIGR01509 family)